MFFVFTAAAASTVEGEDTTDIVRAVMFAEPEHIETYLVGKFDFLQKLPEPARAFRPPAIGWVRVDIRESVKTEFHEHTSVCLSER